MCSISSKKHVAAMIVAGTLFALIATYVLVHFVFVLEMSHRAMMATTISPLLIAPPMLLILGRAMLRGSELRESLQQALDHDHLTGVFNRKYFFDRLAQMTKTTKGSILMVDVDHFKVVNDTHGHFVGDRVIQKVAKTIATTMRTSDFVARFGGEEFVAFIHGDDVGKAAKCAERIRAMIEDAVVQTNDGPVQVTVSIGVGINGPNTSFEQAVFEADEALYCAKQTGRNRVKVAVRKGNSQAAPVVAA